MKKIVKRKYKDGVVRLPDNFRFEDDSDVYLIVEEKEEKSIIEESFGIWDEEKKSI